MYNYCFLTLMKPINLDFLYKVQRYCDLRSSGDYGNPDIANELECISASIEHIFEIYNL